VRQVGQLPALPLWGILTIHAASAQSTHPMHTVRHVMPGSPGSAVMLWPYLAAQLAQPTYKEALTPVMFATPSLSASHAHALLPTSITLSAGSRSSATMCKPHLPCQPHPAPHACPPMQINYNNKHLVGAMIVAGYDSVNKGQAFGCPIGGTLVSEQWVIDGSGSTYIWGFCDSAYRWGAGTDAARTGC
jgi:hypothetical protein